eukprot:jgi/Chlat1/341/Chrsp1S03072
MALKFLNKKSWHTGGLKQIEAVWKAEQKDAAEKSKLEELRREKEKEREQEELKRLQEEAGLVVRQDRLDFLYEGSIALGAQHQAPSAEEYLLGKPLTAVPGSLFVEASALPTANEAWARLHGDPLLQIRQQEQAALARIKQNPVKMEQIQKQASLEKSKRDAMKKEDKRKRKEEKKQRKLQAKAGTDSHNRHDDEVVGSQHKRHRDDSSVDRKHDVEHDRDRIKYRDSDRDRGREMDIGRDRERDKDGDRNRDMYRDKGGDRRRDRVDDHRDRVRHDDLRGAERDIGGDRDREVHRDRRHHERERRCGNDDEERNTHRNGHVKEERRDDVAVEADAARKRPREDDADVKPSALVKRAPHRPGRMTDEERARRLAEMSVDAEVHEKQRVERLMSARHAEQREAEAQLVGKHASFMDAAGQSVYGAGAVSRGTVEESVRRRAHFRQRDTGDAKAFQRG